MASCCKPTVRLLCRFIWFRGARAGGNEWFHFTTVRLFELVFHPSNSAKQVVGGGGYRRGGGVAMMSNQATVSGWWRSTVRLLRAAAL